MRRVINSTYMSVDGVVQDPANWTFDYRDEEAAKFGHEQLFASDALIMGRRTYEVFSGSWPTMTDTTGMADHMNAAAKYVVSDSLGLTETRWNATVIRRAELPDRLAELKRQPGKDIVQYGYGPVTATLLRTGLLDELRIWLHPLLVGGQRIEALLAGVDAGAAKLRLTDARTYDSGLVILSYQPQPAA